MSGWTSQRFPLPMATCGQHYCTPSRRHFMVPLGKGRRVPGRTKALVQSLVSDPRTRAQRVLMHRARPWCLFSQAPGAAAGAPGGWTRDVPRGLPVERHENVWYPVALLKPSLLGGAKPAPAGGCMTMNIKYYGPKSTGPDAHDIQATLQGAELARICNEELKVLMHIMLSGPPPPAAGEAARGAEPELPAGGAHHSIA